jgi:hypothetical protein
VLLLRKQHPATAALSGTERHVPTRAHPSGNPLLPPHGLTHEALRNKVCTVTIDAPSATARTVDLATGTVAVASAAAMTVIASGTDRYGVVLTGPTPRNLLLTVLDAGAVKIG